MTFLNKRKVKLNKLNAFENMNANAGQKIKKDLFKSYAKLLKEIEEE
jgi:hypothetical protein